ncbi:hypothetical protein INR49_002763 [Caranx melampygus]|nr:hypothetical protein INR49_002763 [Caranx melampygus]
MESGHRAPSEQPPIACPGGFLDTAYYIRQPPNNAAPKPPQWDQATRLWTASSGYCSHRVDEFDFRAPAPGGGGFDGTHLALPCGFNASVLQRPFGPPPGHFLNTLPPAPVNVYGHLQELRAGPQPPQPLSDSDERCQQEDEDFRAAGIMFGGSLRPPMGQDHHWRPGTRAAEPEEEATSRKRQDVQWLQQFLKSNKDFVVSKSPRTRQRQRLYHHSVPALREAVYGASQLLFALEDFCYTLRHNMQNDSVWADSHQTVLRTKRELQDRVKFLSHRDRVSEVKAKLNRAGVRRSRRLRARGLLRLEEDHRQERISGREAAIDTWRTMQIHAVEERKKEQGLKLAADTVLCEVRRKQADVKRMQDILRSLEKLRRLRKEAASRKGIVTEQDCDKTFSQQLEHLISVMKKRTVVYSAEEKALMVMLEGEQEEERRREQERRVKKERERHLQRKHRMDAMLFGDECPVDSALVPFGEYYTQAQHSLHSLIQISMDAVPLKMPILQEVQEDIRIIVPDYLTILQETEYEFSLENWVLTGLQSGSTGQHLPLPSSSSSSLLPSCPPYWMMFSSPQQSHLSSCQSSNHWETNLQQHPHTSFTMLASEEKGESAACKTQTCTVTGCLNKESASDQRGQRKAFVPNLLNPPACLSSLPHRRRKNLRQCSLSVLEMTTQHDPNAFSHSQSPSSHRSSSTKTPTTRANSVHRLPSINNHKAMVRDKDFNIFAPVFFFPQQQFDVSVSPNGKEN